MSYLTDELGQRKPDLPYDDMPRDLKILLAKAEKIDSARAETMRRSIAMIDATSLQDSDIYMRGDESEEQIADLCHNAAAGDIKAAAVCVYPNHVSAAAETLKGTGVKVATVNNFPHGDADAETATKQALDAIRDGATEIDTVMDYEACFNADFTGVDEKLAAVAAACHENDVTLKIILKASVYGSYDTLYEVTQRACAHCRDGDYIKTCTGKAPKEGFNDVTVDVSTMPVSVTLMKAISDYNAEHGTDIKLKISGGVKSALDCERYRFLTEQVMGADKFTADHIRFGASSLLDNLRTDLAQSPALNVDAAPVPVASAIKKPGK